MRDRLSLDASPTALTLGMGLSAQVNHLSVLKCVAMASSRTMSSVRMATHSTGMDVTALVNLRMDGHISTLELMDMT